MSPTKVQTVPPDLEQRFVALKKKLVSPENRAKVTESWKRLLVEIEKKFDEIAETGPSYIPKVHWDDIKSNNNELPRSTAELFKERGVLMVDGVIEEEQINTWFEELVSFCKEHPETAGYTYPNPTAWYNVFWTKPQTEARLHPNTQAVFSALSKQFYTESKDLPIDLQTQLVYGDRIRIREPGSIATLPLHLDSSSIERWEDEKYRASYKAIFDGNWEDWDPFRLDERGLAHENLYEDAIEGKSTICSAFRTLQGWLALSNNKSGEGTLKVLPSIKLSMAYIMLRPLFWKDPVSGNIDDYEIDLETPKFPGAIPSTGQLFLPNEYFHHLQHERACISIPDVKKGSWVFWHCDIPHSVDVEHNGDGHSSVLYYGTTPLTVANIKTLLDTRESFLGSHSPEDYASQLTADQKAREFQGASIDHIQNQDGLRSMGLAHFDENEPGITAGQKKIRAIANKALDEGVFNDKY